MPADVNPPVKIDGWWLSTSATGLGSTHLNPSSKQTENAYKIRQQLLGYGFSETAIAGILGNMQKESALSPAAIQKRSACPNDAVSITDVPNNVMINYYNPSNPTADGYGIGLIQWDSYTNTAPAGCTLVSYAIRYNYNWYIGDCQTDRLYFQYLHDTTGAGIPIGGQTYGWWTIYRFSGVDWTFAMFRTISNQYSARVAADIFRACLVKPEYNPESAEVRRDNAAYWYDYFTAHPTAPVPKWLLFNNKRRVTFNVKRFC